MLDAQLMAGLVKIGVPPGVGIGRVSGKLARFVSRACFFETGFKDDYGWIVNGKTWRRKRNSKDKKRGGETGSGGQCQAFVVHRPKPLSLPSTNQIAGLAQLGERQTEVHFGKAI